MPWKSTLRWGANDRAEHNGRTYALWKHPCPWPDDRGNYGASTWWLHPVRDNGNTAQDEQLSASLGGNRKVAQRMAELILVDGWEKVEGRRVETGGELWKSPTGEERPLAELLRGEHRLVAPANR